jgi:glutamate-1-semialdehyde 2,1-aminomutase
MEEREGAGRVRAMQPGSARWFERGTKTIGGAYGHDGRYNPPFPTYIERARGGHKWDVDGNRYIDYRLGNGALMLGHADPDVNAAVAAILEKGTHFGNDHPLQVEWGERVQRLVPCAERVRFVNSGTEANMLACRLARGFTRRPKILRFAGHFHGWHDELLTGMTPPFDVPPSLGLAPGAAAGVTMIPDDDLDLLEGTLAADREIAAVILEASGASWGTVPLPASFLKGVREVTRRHDVLMILDEVITGFRWAPGGAQERFGVTPDLSTHAKIIAGGLPGGAVCGSADILRGLDFTGDSRHDRYRRVMHYGTFNANPLSAAAGIACLKKLDGGEATRRAEEVAAALREGMDAVLERRGIAGYVYGEASTFHIYLAAPLAPRVQRRADLVTTDAATLKGIPTTMVMAVQNGFRARGVELMSYTGGMTCAAHGREDAAQTVSAFDDLMGELAGTVVATL